MLSPFIYIATGFAVSLLLLHAGRKAAFALNFLDRPGGRKQHAQAVPPIGGPVILTVFTALAILHPATSNLIPWPVWSAIWFLLAIGAADDAFHINPWIKFILQVLAACFTVIFSGVEINSLGNLFGSDPVWLGPLAVPFTVLCLAFLMNAVNMMDGLDGLAGGFCTIALFWLMTLCGISGLWKPFWLMAFAAVPLCAFLLLNLRYPWHKRASVFLGDSGALALALLLGWLCITLTQEAGAPTVPATVIWIIALPVMDALAVFVQRAWRGLHPFEADRGHLHHLVTESGLPPVKATPVILLTAFITGAIGVAGIRTGIPEGLLVVLWIVTLFGYIAFRLRLGTISGVDKANTDRSAS